ncbi:hypothetical protein AB6A40_011314 [Gnathostoma spinigerum]|uniref:Uncharacterized protein n=1 Tax=Gnathostoma spinigerum TaxID=75299 RepID=A0ABD6EXC6_9BILA
MSVFTEESISIRPTLEERCLVDGSLRVVMRTLRWNLFYVHRQLLRSERVRVISRPVGKSERFFDTATNNKLRLRICELLDAFKISLIRYAVEQFNMPACCFDIRIFGNSVPRSGCCFSASAVVDGFYRD